MSYKRSHLLYDHYRWSEYEDDNPRISGAISDIAFNRSEGCEILYLINRFMEDWGLEGIQSGQKIERMIRNHLPYNVTTQIDVKIWVKQNWKFY